MHRPAPATVISLIALFFAMSGTAVAATGGNFLLGKSNTATAVTSLTNSKGTALNLSSTSTTPPLTVSNSVQVPKLNASELGGQPATDYLTTTGTAANSSELGGTPASGFIQGGGAITDGRQTRALNGGFTRLVSAPDGDSYAAAECGVIGPSGPMDELYIDNATETPEVATWWNPGGVGQTTLTEDDPSALLDGSTGTNVIVVQVDTGSTISTYTVTENYDSAASTCSFTGQVVDSNG